jgi:hypothetical protein
LRLTSTTPIRAAGCSQAPTSHIGRPWGPARWADLPTLLSQAQDTLSPARPTGLLWRTGLQYPSGSGGWRGEAIRNIYYRSDRQLPPGHDPGTDSGEAPSAGSVAHGH